MNLDFNHFLVTYNNHSIPAPVSSGQAWDREQERSIYRNNIEAYIPNQRHHNPPGLLPVVRYDAVVSAQVPGGDAAQLHGQLLDQPLVAGGLEADPVSGVARQLLVCPNACQKDLEQRSKEPEMNNKLAIPIYCTPAGFSPHTLKERHTEAESA